MGQRLTLYVPGICCRCNCTEDRACPGGCSWADTMRTVCTACVDFGVPEEDPALREVATATCTWCGSAFPGDGEDCGACSLDDAALEAYMRGDRGGREAGVTW